MVEMYRNEENVRESLREKAVSTLCFPPSFWCSPLINISRLAKLNSQQGVSVISLV